MMIIAVTIIILILSAVIHEYAHGWMARRLGDTTAEDEGRLTLNPIKHLDPIGSILVPILLVISKVGFFIAWAKPVPYNPYNLIDRKYGELKVAIAGPVSNIILAAVFALIVRFLPLPDGALISLINGFFTGDDAAIMALTQGSLAVSLVFISLVACFINLALAIFNMMPIPPLDGSKVLAAFLPEPFRSKFSSLERYGLIIVIFLVMLGFFRIIIPVLSWVFFAFIGIPI
ncbi:MAG: site-2 protease family protein [Patescibacteria group bacterium]|nr:MAG: site-2 protease family protein [Patescibacteria group bacterium]